MPKTEAPTGLAALTKEQLADRYNALAAELGRPTVAQFRNQSMAIRKVEGLELERARRAAQASGQMSGGPAKQKSPAAKKATGETMRQQMDRYNALVDEATQLGVPARHNKTVFFNRERGEAKIAALRDAVARARRSASRTKAA